MRENIYLVLKVPDDNVLKIRDSHMFVSEEANTIFLL